MSCARGYGSGLKSVHCTVADCSANSNAVLDGSGDVGHFNSITIGADGLGFIAYYDATNADLKTAHCSNLTCTTAVLVVQDSAGDVGSWTALALGADQLPVLSYHDATNGDLKFLHCSNPLCLPYTRRR